MLTNSNFHIGTSGWSYKQWLGKFYPEGLYPKELLKYYSQRFNTTEINSSFYHLPQIQTVITWAETVPDHFLFCPKISRYITHLRKLKDVEEPIEKFFNIFKNIKHKLGPVLIQLPPGASFNKERTIRFFSILKEKYQEYNFVLEARHESWFKEEGIAQLKQYAVGLVISHSGGYFPYHETITSENIYFRFHGPKELFGSNYPEDILRSYAQKCSNWIASGYKIWAFFNNDGQGYAPGNALMFKSVLNNLVNEKNKIKRKTELEEQF